MNQRGFFFDADRCVNCHACEAACQAANGLAPNTDWRKVIEVWQGEFPNVARTFASLSCLHCAEPPCQNVCPAGAISKRLEDGIVVVDRQLCMGCHECYDMCPRRAPQFGADGIMAKCDFCLEIGRAPACAAACPAGALLSGAMEELAGPAAKRGGKRLGGKENPSMLIAHHGPELPINALVMGERAPGA